MNPNYSQERSTLSQRAKAVSDPSVFPSAVWDNVAATYHPTDNPEGVISLGIAENSLMHQELVEFVNSTTHITPHALTYGDGPVGTNRLRYSVARFLNRRLAPIVPLELDHIIVTNGLSHAIEHLAWCFADPGDGLLLAQPYYASFINDVQLRPKVEVVKVALGEIDPMSTCAVAEHEKAIVAAKARGVTVKGLILCNPHNPLGRCYARDVIIAYMQLCQKYQIHFISDEIYMFSVWKNPHDTLPEQIPFTSALTIPLDGVIDPVFVHILWGMSKDFGANGLRIGYLITQKNQALRRACLDLGPYAYASLVAEHICANILEDEEWTDRYIAINKVRLSESYSFVVKFLNDHQIPYFPGSNAAFFLWVDLGKAYIERNPKRSPNGEVNAEISKEIDQLLMGHKVWLANGVYFGTEKPGFFRIVFSHPIPLLEMALIRVARAISDS